MPPIPGRSVMPHAKEHLWLEMTDLSFKTLFATPRPEHMISKEVASFWGGQSGYRWGALSETFTSSWDVKYLPHCGLTYLEMFRGRSLACKLRVALQELSNDAGGCPMTNRQQEPRQRPRKGEQILRLHKFHASSRGCHSLTGSYPTGRTTLLRGCSRKAPGQQHTDCRAPLTKGEAQLNSALRIPAGVTSDSRQHTLSSDSWKLRGQHTFIDERIHMPGTSHLQLQYTALSSSGHQLDGWCRTKWGLERSLPLNLPISVLPPGFWTTDAECCITCAFPHGKCHTGLDGLPFVVSFLSLAKEGCRCMRDDGIDGLMGRIRGVFVLRCPNQPLKVLFSRYFEPFTLATTYLAQRQNLRGILPMIKRFIREI